MNIKCCASGFCDLQVEELRFQQGQVSSKCNNMFVSMIGSISSIFHVFQVGQNFSTKDKYLAQ